MRKEETFQINDLVFHLGKLAKKKANKTHSKKKKEIKIGAETNRIKTRKTVEKINEPKN